MYRDQQITLVIPCLNEEEGIQRVLSRVRLAIMQEDLPDIDKQWVVRGNRVEVEPVPPSRRGQRRHRPSGTQPDLQEL